MSVKTISDRKTLWQEYLQAQTERDFSALLTTEARHPKTFSLAQDSKTDLLKAIQSCWEVNHDALNQLQQYDGNVLTLQQAIDNTLQQGGRVFITGCGSSGRLALNSGKIFRELAPDTLKDKIIDFIAGGDTALVKAVEKFEDNRAFGKQQLVELEFGPNDLLIASSASGDAPFVQEILKAATEISQRKPWYLFCNPTEEIKKRNHEHILHSHAETIQYLELNVGPLALSGSTRMQTSDALFFAIAKSLMYSISPSEESFTASYHASLEKLLNKISNLTPEQHNGLKVLIEKEALCYQNNETVNYLVDKDLALCVFTDVTERSPTFNLIPLENQNCEAKKDRYAQTYLMIKDCLDANQAWHQILQREARPLNWPNLPQTSTSELYGFDFSMAAISKRQEYVSTPAHTFRINRTENQLSLCFDSELPLLELDVDGLDSLETELFLKMLLNLHSTLVMGRNNKYYANIMGNVNPSNCKLIGRGINYSRDQLNASAVKCDAESLEQTFLANILRLEANESIIENLVNGLVHRKYDQAKFLPTFQALVDLRLDHRKKGTTPSTEAQTEACDYLDLAKPLNRKNKLSS